MNCISVPIKQFILIFLLGKIFENGMVSMVLLFCSRCCNGFQYFTKARVFHGATLVPYNCSHIQTCENHAEKPYVKGKFGKVQGNPRGRRMPAYIGLGLW